MVRLSRNSGRIILFLAVVATIALVVIGFFPQGKSEPQYAHPHEGCSYYKVEDLPSTFEHIVGYAPELMLDRKKSVATLYFRKGIELKVPVGLYAQNTDGNELWCFEVPSEKVGCFRNWDFLAYPCFSQELERQFRSYGLDGIYYSPEDLDNIFSFLGWTSERLEIFPDGSASFSDSNILYYPKYRISESGEFYLEGRDLGQMLYEHEMSSHPQEKISYDIFFYEGSDL